MNACSSILLTLDIGDRVFDHVIPQGVTNNSRTLYE